MHPGRGTNSNPVQSILVCFTRKHRNPIRNALNILKGTISVMQWITFVGAKQMSLDWFSGLVYVNTHVHTPGHFLYQIHNSL